MPKPIRRKKKDVVARKPRREDLHKKLDTQIKEIKSGQKFLFNRKQEKLAEALRRKRDPGTDNSPHLMITARAGTGKTTTLIEGLKLLKGLEPSIKPSDQQQAVWDKLLLSKGRVQTVGFVAFGKDIAQELKKRVPEGVETMTMHSFGYNAVRKAFGEIRCEANRVTELLAKVLGTSIYQMRGENSCLLNTVKDLVRYCKINLITQPTEEDLIRLSNIYDVDIDYLEENVFSLVPKVLELSLDVKRDMKVDYDDMIFLPNALNLPTYKYDLLLVDECQDLNKCTQNLAVRGGRRVVCVGDSRQAIFGFAGADSTSMANLALMLGSADRGMDHLNLTKTRRCPKRIVEHAKRIVPDFECLPEAPEGMVREVKFEVEEYVREVNSVHKDLQSVSQLGFASELEPGDFVLCRNNAPLVRLTLRLLRHNRRALMLGRNIGRGLTNLVLRLAPTTLPDLIEKVGRWYELEKTKEEARLHPDENKLASLVDRRECIVAFCQEVNTLEELHAKMDVLFSDENKKGCIILSSIHKAKGLEADRVFLILHAKSGLALPGNKAKGRQLQEQLNLLYVAQTRAKRELVFVK